MCGSTMVVASKTIATLYGKYLFSVAASTFLSSEHEPSVCCVAAGCGMANGDVEPNNP
jgi:urease accessory protein UreH